MTNIDLIGLLNDVRLVLLNLGKDRITAISFRAKDGKGIIEVVPDERLLATGEKNGFGFYVDNGVSVIWRKQ
jgi:hypothetical protein